MSHLMRIGFVVSCLAASGLAHAGSNADGGRRVPAAHCRSEMAYARKEFRELQRTVSAMKSSLQGGAVVDLSAMDPDRVERRLERMEAMRAPQGAAVKEEIASVISRAEDVIRIGVGLSEKKIRGGDQLIVHAGLIVETLKSCRTDLEDEAEMEENAAANRKISELVKAAPR